MNHCTVTDTGWRADDEQAVAFLHQAAELAVSLGRFSQGDAIAPLSGRAEEMGAVLEGEFTLDCGEEHYALGAGDGILIPRGEPRVWTLVSEHGALYRVWRHADAAA